MTPEFLLNHAISPALRLLPGRMNSQQAVAMMIAIALQESGLKHRRQIGGSARGYFQFEQGGGVRGVLMHPASGEHIKNVLVALDYAQDADAGACYAAIQHNDVLAAAFARLLLWTLPDPMPNRDSPGKGWTVYMKAWRPGKPHREPWNDHFETAWEIA